ncbi:MAG: hypothetical protein LBO79_02940 [Zoogloeaceae bacterium]|jgi:hypothetical protein|nr:hypothetical protein [Zoogloeaceae bacterium]
MVSFRDIAARMDDAVFGALSDEAVIDGRPVRGMFSIDAPINPNIGRLRTNLIEPLLQIREQDADDVRNGSAVEALGDKYVVVDCQRDGTGLLRLKLRPE